MAGAAGCARLPSRLLTIMKRPKLSGEPIASCKTFTATPPSQGVAQQRSPLPQGRTLILGCISLRLPGVSQSNEIFSREGWGAPVSGGIDCSDAAPD